MIVKSAVLQMNHLLKSQFLRKQKTLQTYQQRPHLWLISDHSDLDSAAAILQNFAQTLVMRCSLEDWDKFLNAVNQSDSILKSALEEFNISDLAVCGSLTNGSDHALKLSEVAVNRKTVLNPPSLAHRIGMREYLSGVSQQRVLHCVNSLEQIDFIRRAVEAKQLAVHPFFFSPGRRQFQLFDREKSSFKTSHFC